MRTGRAPATTVVGNVLAARAFLLPAGLGVCVGALP